VDGRRLTGVPFPAAEGPRSLVSMALLRPRRRPGVLLALVPLLWLGAACRATAPAPPSEAAAVPTLEEIFLIPGIHGRPPRAEGLSADGEWLVLRWSPIEDDGQGGRRLAEQGSVRLLSVRDPEASEHRGEPLASLLFPASPVESDEEAGEDEAPGQDRRARRGGGGLQWAWSRHGARLAVARGGDLFLCDPPAAAGEAWRVTPLFGDPRPARREDPDAARAEGRPARLGTVRSLAFTGEDEHLIVSTPRHRFLFPLGSGAPLALDDARWLDAEIDGEGGALAWSDDHSVVFSPRGAIARVPAPSAPDGAGTTGEGKEASSAAAPLRGQVIALASGRVTALEGWADARMEAASLSRDGRHVYASEIDRSDEPPPTLVPDFLTPRVTTREARRLLADDVPSPVRAWLWDTATGERTELVPGLPEGERAGWISTLGWAPAGEPARFALARDSADHRTRELWCWSEGLWRQVFVDHDPRWQGGPAGGARWSGDGSVLLLGSECTPLSTTPGRCQLFAVDPYGAPPRQLTEVEGEVSSFVPRRDGSVVLAASGADPARRELWFLPASLVRGEGGAPRRLRAPDGMNGALLPAGEGDAVVFTHGELGVPDELWVTSLDGETPARRLTRTIPAAFEAVPWILPRKLEVTHADGTRVRAHVYLPDGTSLEDPDRPRPCVVFIHGAGYLQNVTDSMTQYDVNLMFHSRLARLGYVVADVDYRGSAGYGNRFRTDVQHRLGGPELDDIHLAVDELVRRGLVDPGRVGCYGGSYGGFLTLMALFRAPERWTCGAALRSVTDWRTYHPRYTQPRLGRPSTHAEAYARSSPIDHAAGLEDPLLILHGMRDSNVFAQDSIRLIERLIDLGKDFDAMLYPSQDHAFTAGSAWLDQYKRIERFLRRHLGDPREAPAPAP
jgi:dipeptidyl aminopeptidase/acylaminoacyl peptidase